MARIFVLVALSLIGATSHEHNAAAIPGTVLLWPTTNTVCPACRCFNCVANSDAGSFPSYSISGKPFSCAVGIAVWRVRRKGVV